MAGHSIVHSIACKRNKNVNLHFKLNYNVIQMHFNKVIQMQMHVVFWERGYTNMYILSPHIYFLGLVERKYILY
jgi:hypothetical protein